MSDAVYTAPQWRAARATIATATGTSRIEVTADSAEFTDDRGWSPSIGGKLVAILPKNPPDVTSWRWWSSDVPRRCTLWLEYGPSGGGVVASRSTTLELVTRNAVPDFDAGTVTMDLESRDYVLDTAPYTTTPGDGIAWNAGTDLQTIRSHVLSVVDPSNVWGLAFTADHASTATRRRVLWRHGQTARAFLLDVADAAGGLSIVTRRDGRFEFLNNAWDLSSLGVVQHELTDATVLRCKLRTTTEPIVNTVLAAYSDRVVSHITPTLAHRHGFIGRRVRYLDYTHTTSTGSAAAGEVAQVFARSAARCRVWEVDAIAHYPLAPGNTARMAARGWDVTGRVLAVTHRSEGTMTVHIAEQVT